MPIRTFKPEYILPGTRIGGYVVCSQVGQGSGAVVYDVVSADGSHYALKMSRFPPSESPFDASSMMAKRFARSVHCHLQLMSCPSVARLVAHDWHPSPEKGWPYLVQELVPGSVSITDWAKDTSPSLRQIVCAFQALGSACGEMTRLQIHHRDLKPANIMMTPDGVPKIVDFNSADHSSAEPLTYPAASGQPGTVIYLPPELCLAIIRQRTTGEEVAFVPRPSGDLHALGCILYEVLVGEHPYDIHEDSLEQLKEIAYRETPIPQILNEGIPLGLTKAVMRLLRKDPSQRYQHGDQVAKDLAALLDVADESWDLPFAVPRDEGPKIRLLRRETAPAPAARSPIPEPSPSPKPIEESPPPMVARPRRIQWLRVGLAGALLVSGYVSGRLVLREKWREEPAPAVVVQRSPAPSAGPAPAVPCPEGDVRQCDLRWLATCPDESRRTAELLRLESRRGSALLQRGDNIIPLPSGCQVRAGAVEARASIGRYTHVRLLGTATTDAEGASIRFHAIDLEDGRRPYPICAVGGARGLWPGLDRISRHDPTRVPDSMLWPGYAYVVTGALDVLLATGEWPAGGFL